IEATSQLVGERLVLDEAVLPRRADSLLVETHGLQILAVDPRHFCRQQRIAILEVRRTMVRPQPMSAQLLAKVLSEHLLPGGSRPWIERGQRQGTVEMVSGDQQHSEGAAQHLRSQPGGCECLVIVAKEEADDLSQSVKAHASVALGPVRIAEARPLEVRRRIWRSFQTRNEVLLEPGRVAIPGTLGDDIRVLPARLQDIVQPVSLLSGQS